VLLAFLPLGRLLRQHLVSAPFFRFCAMMLALLLLSLATFGYLCYVLLKPENF
jgi:K+-transporting ATPase KdpF subunit